MRYLLLEPFHGAAGDMITGALISLGADQQVVARAMGSVVADPEFLIVGRAGIMGTSVKTHAGRACRSLDEVVTLVKGASAPVPAIEMAIRVFQRIARAEYSVHGEQAHFHEVGADDAIADVIGACTALYTLCPDGVAVMPVALGGGTISCDHGTIPAPGPATLAILKESSLIGIFGNAKDGELCTPTGAALLAEFATLLPEEIGPGKIVGTGYGAGTRDTPDSPNVLRAVLLETSARFSSDQVDVLETNVDDVNGEIIGHAIAILMSSGARDASAIPCVMKKGRVGYLIRVICLEKDSLRLAGMMAAELGTLGVRCMPSVHRFIARRTIEQVPVEFGGETHMVPVKCGWIEDQCYTMKAEFDDARVLAEKLGVPVREMLRIIEEQAGRILPVRGVGEPYGPRAGAERQP